MHVANGTGRALRPAFICSTLYGEQAGLDRWKPGFYGSTFAAAERRSRSAPGVDLTRTPGRARNKRK
jgi:hypothetical protein